MLANRVRGLLAALVLLASSVAVAMPGAASAQHRAHHHRHHVRSHHHGIPQHGGGDRDADNFGGPSDGDGNV
jgi:hypothetical protein